ncbi:MAG: hypothetical protein ACF8SC_12380 [Phycisphaerales bacterium JB037]
MLPTVVLHHQFPDDHPLGPSHYDWLLDPGGSREHRLITFRLARRPDTPDWTRFEAERLPDHRAFYLSHQGPVSGDRGTVTRVARGRCEVLRNEPDLLKARIEFDAWSGAILARPHAAGWSIERG